MTTKTIAIIDYGLGNLGSVLNAFNFIDSKAFIADTPSALKNATHIVLPGVGAFGQGMQNLQDKGWIDPIKQAALNDKKPFLGICLGMQLLASSSNEHGNHTGLNLIPGIVGRIEKTSDIRIPHIGWNGVHVQNSAKTYAGIETPEDYYFVHSYIYHPENPTDTSGLTTHGQEFTSSVERDNIWGVQFHPEKSQKAGLQILKNFWEA